MTVTAMPGRRWDVYELNVEKNVPGLGQLEIKPAAAGRGLVPGWAGTKVKGGQLYHQPGDALNEHHDPAHGDDHDEASGFEPHPGFLFLAGTTAVTTIEPSDGEQLDDPRRMRKVKTLTVEWKSKA